MTFAPETEQAQRDLAAWLAAVQRGAGRCLVAGINGAQGSGKTTWCRELERHLWKTHGLRAVTLALDDFYLTRSEREAMARDVHPLFVTRGVPGTHDTTLGRSVLDAGVAGRPVRVPRFDKALDDRLPETQWREVDGGVDVVLFEGWCVGAVEQSDGDFMEPVNELEGDEDPNRVWVTRVNSALATSYRDWFGRLDVLVMLDVRRWDVVREMRTEQENALRRDLAQEGRSGRAMTAAQLDRFLAHYERFTRWQLQELPRRAHAWFELAGRRVVNALLSPPDRVATELSTFRFPFDTGTISAHLRSNTNCHGSC